MTPIDDELRDLLHGRADRLAPPRDPLAGIETRARAIRRRRAATAVVSAALAVSAVTLAVPLLDHAVDRDRSEPATPASPTASPSPSPDGSPAARPASALAWSRLHPAADAERAALLPLVRTWSAPAGIAADDVVVEDLGSHAYENSRVRVVQVWSRGNGPVLLAGREYPGGRVQLLDQAVPSPDLPVVTVDLPVATSVVIAAFTERADARMTAHIAGSMRQPFEPVAREAYVQIADISVLPEGDFVEIEQSTGTASLPVTLGVDHGAGASGEPLRVNWPARGTPVPDVVRTQALARWHVRHPGPKPREYPLWYAVLPTGQGAYVAQMQVGAAAPRVVVWQGVPGDRGFVVKDLPTPEALAAVTSLLMGSDGPYVLVVGDPRTTGIRYAPDGKRFTTERSVDGVAVFLQRLDTPGVAKVRLLDRAGRLLAAAGVDAGPVTGS